MGKIPLVSILLLSMNHEEFIEQCIQSLIDQTYKNIEIIYLDNASSDNTFETGERLIKNSLIPNKIFRNHESNGISKNLNFLLDNSSGSYIMALSTDDWLTNDSIKEKIHYFNLHPKFGMIYSSTYFFLHNNKETVICKTKSKGKEGWILKDILKENFINTTGCIIKRSTIESIGKYDENSIVEDWEMWIRIAEKFPIGYINKELAYYRLRNGVNITANYKYMIKGYDYIIQKYSHYTEIRNAKKLITTTKVYHYATWEPSLKTLLFIMKNWRFNYFYFKQSGKTILGIMRNQFISAGASSKIRNLSRIKI